MEKMNQEISNERERVFQPPQFGDTRIVDGVTYQYIDTGYTLREYYAHTTPEKGPGPGWDTRTLLLDDAWAMEKFGVTFSENDVWSGSLPDIPLGQWVEVENS
jgi:hypothetical protein